MILGVSHIVLGTGALETDATFFRGRGYELRFIERALPTHPGKRPFMTTTSGHQSLAMCSPPSGPSLELIHYDDRVVRSSSPLQLVLPGAPEATEGSNAVDGAVGDWAEREGGSVRSQEIPGMSTPLWFGTERAAGVIVHRVRDLDRAEAFWRSLGWTPGEDDPPADTWRRLDFPSVMKQWRARLLLVRSDAAVADSVLDTGGYRCLSLVTSSLASDADSLHRAGATKSTGRMEYVINSKSLALEIFAGPDGVMVELMEVRRGGA